MEISISDELNSIINFSREEAMRTGSYGIAPDHLFLGILRHRENTAVDALRGAMIDIEEMKQFIAAINEDKEVPVGIHAGLMSVVLAKAAKKSLDEHRPVKISEILEA